MLADISLGVEGMEDLEKKLLALGAQTGFKTLRAAGRLAMKPVVAAIKSGANVDTGDLRDSIAMSAKKGKGGARAVNIEVGPVRKKATKSEGGRDFKRIYEKAIAQEYGTHGNHWQAAKPFIRPALNDNAEGVLATFQRELSKAIDKAVKKQAST